MLKQSVLPEQGEPSPGVPRIASAPLPALASLTKAAPSPQLPWQLVDLLYCYCLTARLYNGEHHQMAQVRIRPDRSSSPVICRRSSSALCCRPCTAMSSKKCDTPQLACRRQLRPLSTYPAPLGSSRGQSLCPANCRSLQLRRCTSAWMQPVRLQCAGAAPGRSLPQS